MAPAWSGLVCLRQERRGRRLKRKEECSGVREEKVTTSFCSLCGNSPSWNSMCRGQ